MAGSNPHMDSGAKLALIILMIKYLVEVSMNGVGNRIEECLEKINMGDGENAFIQLSSAIEATSKLAYPYIHESSQRYRKFVKESIPFVMWSLSNGAPFGNLLYFEIFKNGKYQYVSFEDIIYKLMRCEIVHNANISETIVLSYGNYIAVTAKEIFLPIAVIESFAWAVIANPVNKSQVLHKNSWFTPYNSLTHYDLNLCWGNEADLRSIIRNGFTVDYEKAIACIHLTKEGTPTPPVGGGSCEKERPFRGDKK